MPIVHCRGCVIKHALSNGYRGTSTVLFGEWCSLSRAPALHVVFLRLADPISLPGLWWWWSSLPFLLSLLIPLTEIA